MADEVPVCDVLSEAMEYLSKLGTNLRARSENLKEKKISRGKLKNSHAVQKVANKVLLICELSKKSLDNVETGVRKVLSLVEKSYGASSNNGAKSSESRKESNPVHFIEYKSQKLRMSTKINLKHYMSAKVKSRKMPPAMQSKYPVYYDCKLYRSRKIESETQEGKDADSDDNTLIKIIPDKKSSINNDRTKDVVPETDTLSPKSTNSQKHEEADNQINHKKSTKEQKATHKRRHLSTDSSGEEKKRKKHRKHSHGDGIETINKKSRENSTEKPPKCNEINKRSTTEKCEQEANESKKVDDSVKIIEDNSKSDDEFKKCNKDKILEAQSNNSEKLHIDSDQNEENNEDMDTNKFETSENDKPLIRCININKLLKPDVAKKSSSKSVTDKKKHISKTKPVKTEKTQHSTISKNEEPVLDTKNDEEYWTLKRAEVKAFKPRSFSINVARLPKLSQTFLQKYGLVRIVKKGHIIFEVDNNTASNGGKLSVEKITKVKNALLNDSDSDENSTLPVKSKKVHKAIIDSDSENNESEQNPAQTNDNNEDSMIDNVISKDVDAVDNNTNVTEDTPDTKIQEKTKSTEKNETANELEITVELNKNAENETNKSKDQDNSSNELEKNEFKNIDENQKTKNHDVQKKETDTEKIKVALLNESDSEKSDKETVKDQGEKTTANNKKPSHETLKTSDPKTIKDALLKDSDSDKNEEEHDKSYDLDTSSPHNIDMENLAKTVTDIIKKNLLIDSDSDHHDDNTPVTKDNQVDMEKDNPNQQSENLEKIDPGGPCPTQTDSHKENSEQEPTPIKVQRVKSSLLNESSSESDSKKKRESHSKSESVKKKLGSLSNSDVEKEHSKSSHDDDVRLKHKRRKKKHRYTRSSSSSSEDLRMNPRKKLKLKLGLSKKSIPEDSAGEKGSQEDGRSSDDDNLSNASSLKMVRSKAKPSGSSGQSSDNQETSDKDIDGLTNLNNLTKPRRRDSTSTTNTQSTMSTRRSSRPKAKSTIGEDFLQAETSSESSEEAANEDQDIEDLPAVPLSGLNGGGIEHLAKDDLLEDTDSSVSNKDKAENAESDQENKVKLKRRKGHAISSDSEGGTSNKKDKEFKMSDFEDSEDDSSETGTKSKRKKKDVDSDGSSGSNDGGKKKRRRIKVINDSDASGSDTENEGRNKHGRKNIRKVMGKNQLEEATKKAAREEKERIARIAERQKLYNNLEFDESGKPDEVVLDKVILDFDPETKEPLIEVDRGLVKKLKPHQANGIKFMWDACFESVKRIKKDRGSGCILAHCMGLGKTLQVVSLTHTLLIHGDLTGVNRVLVVCPLSTVLNWVNEFRMWLKHADSEFDVDVYELSRFKQNSERAFQLQQWFDNGGVCVLGYEMFRNLSADNNKKFKKKMLKSFQESLVDPGPDLVVCDEGHLLKNEKTSLSQSMNKVKTQRRIVLTGTPLQNNLKEYYCMVQFVKPNLLGKYNEYLNRFVNPITNGQYTDSTEHDIKIMKRRSHVLHKMLDGAVQRRDYGVLAPFLPPKHEFVLFITLTELQIKLYQFYLDNYSRRPLPGKSSGFLFPDFQSLQRIWTHPLVLKYNSERYEIMQQKKREREEEDSEGSLVDFIDDDSTPDESSTDESSDDLSDVSDDSRKKSKKKKNPKKSKKESKASSRRGTRANPVEIVDDDEHNDDIIEVKNDNPTEWWIPLVEEEEIEDMRNSNKLVLLFDILRQCEAIGDKLLVFSQSLYSLDLIEHFLGKVDEATQEARIDEKLGGHVGSWSPGVDYFRLDGSTSCENRSIWCKNFNREDNPRARLFLISTRAGGLGINLVAANRVVIFDVSWNPSHDVQSIFRVYRFGQKKPCYIYRFLAMGTMEEKIYERQVTKQAISKRVIDEQQIDRHYAENDLAELYKFEPHPPSPRPVPSLPKDRLFAEMLKDHEAQIYKFHEHDSLLENKEEETLSEEERKAAWDDFENEKNRPPPAPFVSPWPMHNGMMPGLLAQQQQLAYAALAAMLRKDLPNINDNQIRDMLPLIYSSNPGMFGGYDYGLMQKMSEIYKYAQPGMMNPSMMNPAMNAGAGGGAAAGAGSGGTSGLQYSPPWQRQQQQQQQMRLQQIMQQQQNQMGAKFYAGGLGSRDPIAMALQQQRAREIMMGGGGQATGRPRGRPPLQPRAPPAPQPMPASDVVNLDSD